MGDGRRVLGVSSDSSDKRNFVSIWSKHKYTNVINTVAWALLPGPAYIFLITSVLSLTARNFSVPTSTSAEEICLSTFFIAFVSTLCEHYYEETRNGVDMSSRKEDRHELEARSYAVLGFLSCWWEEERADSFWLQRS